MEKIIYKRPDGGVSIVRPAPKFINGFRSPEEGLAAVVAKAVPADASDVAVVDSVPADRTFRNAWRQSAGVFSVDIGQAREIHAANIAAAKRAQARDIVEREAMGEDVTAARTALQADLKPQIDAAGDTDALAAVWPAGLARI